MSMACLARYYRYNNGMTTLKLTRVGNSVGVVFPKEVLARLNLAAGDAIILTEAPDGYRLSPFDAEFEDHVEVAKEIMKRRKAALRELAK